MLRSLSSLALGVLLVGAEAIAVGEEAPQKFALVIGNSDYKKFPLKNPGNDAEKMSQALQALGFQVTKHTDLRRDAMSGAIDDFAKLLTKDSVACFYYAGHGVHARGKNYLVPIDESIASQHQIPGQSIDLQRVASGLKDSPAEIKLLILDCGFSHPFDRRGDATSIKPSRQFEDAGSGTMFLLAADGSSTALDGTDNNSPLTLAVAEVFSQRPAGGLRLMEAVAEASERLVQMLGDDHKPFVRFDLALLNHYLTPPGASPKALAEPDRSAPAVANRAGGSDPQENASASHGGSRRAPGTKAFSKGSAASIWRHENATKQAKRKAWTEAFRTRTGRLPMVVETPWWETAREVEENLRLRDVDQTPSRPGVNHLGAGRNQSARSHVSTKPLLAPGSPDELSLAGLSIDTLSAVIADGGAAAETRRLARLQRAALYQEQKTADAFQRALIDYRSAGEPGIALKIEAEATLRIGATITGTLTTEDVALVSLANQRNGRLWFYIKSVNGDDSVKGWLDSAVLPSMKPRPRVVSQERRPLTTLRGDRAASTSSAGRFTTPTETVTPIEEASGRPFWQRGTQTLELRQSPKSGELRYSGRGSRNGWWSKSENQQTAPKTAHDTQPDANVRPNE